MRTMTYRIELERDDGYMISNADVSWEGMPERENFTHAPIKVSNAPWENGQIVANVDDYVELGSDYEDTDPYFRDNYLKALHEKSRDWKLIGVRIDSLGATLLFGNRATHRIEFLYIGAAPFLRVWFDVQRADGSTDRYLLRITEAGNERRAVRVTEYFSGGRREIAFNRGGDFDAKCPDTNWAYAYVTEYLD